MDFQLEGPLNKAFTLKMDTTRDGVHYTKFEQDVKLENTAEKLMVDTKVDITMDPFSVLYNLFCWEDAVPAQRPLLDGHPLHPLRHGHGRGAGLAHCRQGAQD